MSYSYSYLKTPQFRAFIRQVASGPKARFLDIGPVHPGGQSITTPLYEMGWQGINVEPVKAYLDYLKKVRGSDIHLQGVVSNDNQALVVQDLGPLGYNLQKASDSSATGQAISQWSIQQLLEQNHLASIEVLHLDGRAIFNPETFHLDFSSIKPWLIILENFTASTQFQTALDLHYQQVLTQPHLIMLIAKDQTQLLQAVTSLKDASLADLSRQSAFQFSLVSWLIPKIKSRLKSPRIIRIAKDIKIIIEEERVIQTGLRVVKRQLKSTSIGKKLQRFKNRNSPLPAHYYDELPPLQTHSEQSLQLLEQLKSKQATLTSSKG
jgi:hypothetical protein